MVDAGWGDDNGWQGLNAGLAEIGHSVTDIEGVVVTHFHPDHTGLCGRVREASGAWIAMHEDDHYLFDQMSTARDDEWMAYQLENMERAGAPKADRDAFRLTAAGESPVGPESAPDRLLADDEIIALTGRGLRVVYTPATRLATSASTSTTPTSCSPATTSCRRQPHTSATSCTHSTSVTPSPISSIRSHGCRT
ncbi:hypothetical protein GCM10020255_094900 [Rhodococcus baikonurensis]